MTYIVALTGGIGSGKTTISNSFKKIGIDVIDTDVIGRNIIEYNLKISYSIKKKFGKRILNTDNSINRLLLKKYIIINNNYRLWLENLLHPEIYKETKKKIQTSQSNWCLWVVPLLIEKKLEQKSNRILLIDAHTKDQIKRIMKRDQMSLEETKKIISLQATRAQRISICDDIIFNKNKIKKINLYIHYFNKFYSYLSYEYKKNQEKNLKKNYLTKFY